MQEQFIILGMHRSGTSLVAKMLHEEFGIFMGNSFLPADRHNIYGYFEDLEFLTLNKSILSNIGADWKTILTQKDIMGVDGKFHVRISELVSKRNKRHLTWGWKDPRTTYLTWLYHEHLSFPRYIIVRRRKLEILNSLYSCWGGNLRNWLDLIDSYNGHIKYFMKHYKPDRIVVSFNKLLQGRTEEKDRLLQWVES